MYTMFIIILIIFCKGYKIYGEENSIYIDYIKYKIVEDDPQKEYGSVKIVKQDNESSIGNIINIPEKIKDSNGREYFVVEIGEEAFKGNKQINTVYIPYTIEVIEKSAFEEVENLEKVYIKEESRLYKIEKSAFCDCKKLKEINIPEHVEIIGKYAFCNCQCLNEIRLSKKLTELNEAVFSGCSSLKNIDISNIRTIKMSALKDCINLNRVELSEKLNYIGDGAFFNCNELKYINIPDNVESIETSAFFGCNNITKIKIPSSIRQLKDSVFKGCSSLSEIELLGSVERIYTEAFSDCSNLKKIIFRGQEPPDIDVGAFNGCKNIVVEILGNKNAYEDTLKKFNIFDIKNDSKIEEKVSKQNDNADVKEKENTTTKKRRKKFKEEIINEENWLIENYISNLLRWNEEDIRLAAYDLSIAISMKKINIYI